MNRISDQWAKWSIVGLLLIAAITYLGGACPYLLGGDSGEFDVLYAQGGVAHPPGYPLYVLCLRALSWLPASTPAQGAARATALLACLTVLALYLACRSYRASPAAATFAAATYAFASETLLLGTQAEVFTLTSLLAALLVASSGPDFPVRGARRMAAIALLGGLGFSHQQTIAAVAPVALVGIVRAWREQRERRRSAWRVAAVAPLAFIAGLLPYGYLLWASRHPGFVWGDAMDLKDLWHHVARVAYWFPSDPHALESVAPHLVALARHVFSDLGFLAPLLAILGIIAALARKPRVDGITIAITILLAGPILIVSMVATGGMSNRMVELDGLTRHTIKRFYLMSEMLLCIPLSWSVGWLFSRFKAALLPPILTAGIIFFQLFSALPRVRGLETATVEHYLRDTLSSLPKDAVVVGTGDHRFFGFSYAQEVLKLRPDVIYIDRLLVDAPWYARRIGATLGDPDWSHAGDIFERLMASGRPIFISDIFDTDVVNHYISYPLGTVIRVLPSGAEMPAPEDVEALNVEAAAHFTAVAPPKDAEPSWANEAYETYARPWDALARVFQSRGMMDKAQLNHERAVRHAL